MTGLSDNPYNPNPIVKLFTTFLFGFTVMNILNIYFGWAAVILLSFIFYQTGFKKEAIRNILTFGLLSFLPGLDFVETTHPFVKMFLLLLIVYKMFYFPITSGMLMVKTSDVGSIITTMDVLRLPRSISIPIAVMFRFFPSFKEEHRNIKLAMKIRGIGFKNPLAYLEYVTVPLLITSSNIADDISKAAETRCIANPIRKTRYLPVKVKPVDFIYTALVAGIVVFGGYIW